MSTHPEVQYFEKILEALQSFDKKLDGNVAQQASFRQGLSKFLEDWDTTRRSNFLGAQSSSKPAVTNGVDHPNDHQHRNVNCLPGKFELFDLRPGDNLLNLSNESNLPLVGVMKLCNSLDEAYKTWPAINEDEESVINEDEESVISVDQESVINVDEESVIDEDEESMIDEDEESVLSEIDDQATSGDDCSEVETNGLDTEEEIDDDDMDVQFIGEVRPAAIQPAAHEDDQDALVPVASPPPQADDHEANPPPEADEPLDDHEANPPPEADDGEANPPPEADEPLDNPEANPPPEADDDEANPPQQADEPLNDHEANPPPEADEPLNNPEANPPPEADEPLDNPEANPPPEADDDEASTPQEVGEPLNDHEANPSQQANEPSDDGEANARQQADDHEANPPPGAEEPSDNHEASTPQEVDQPLDDHEANPPPEADEPSHHGEANPPQQADEPSDDHEANPPAEVDGPSDDREARNQQSSSSNSLANLLQSMDDNGNRVEGIRQTRQMLRASMEAAAAAAVAAEYNQSSQPRFDPTDQLETSLNVSGDDLEHNNTSAPPKPFECVLCPKKYENKCSLAKHIKIAHSIATPLKPNAPPSESGQFTHSCSVPDCNFRGKCRGDVRSHQFKHHHEKFFKFSTCAAHPKDCKLYKSWRSFENYRDTFVASCPTCQYECSKCGDQFKVVNDLVKHAAASHLPTFGISRLNPERDDELDERPPPPKQAKFVPRLGPKKTQYQCEQCPEKFEDICLLRNHQHIKHSAKFFKCAQCAASVFENVNELKAHIQEEHPGYASNELFYQCFTCSQMFQLDEALKYHVWNTYCEHIGRTRVAASRAPQQQPPSNNDNNHQQGTPPTASEPRRHIQKLAIFKCRNCHKFFRDSQQLKRHRQKAHPQPVVNRLPKFVCGFRRCQFWARVRSQVQLHQLAHPKEEYYQCLGCRSAFKYEAFVEHMRHQHPGDTDTKIGCAPCGAPFDGTAALFGHVWETHIRVNVLSL